MRTLLLLFFVLFLFFISGLAFVIVTGPDGKRRRILRRQLAHSQAVCATYRSGVDHLRELVWTHRDIAPELATITLDEIRQLQARADNQIGPR